MIQIQRTGPDQVDSRKIDYELTKSMAPKAEVHVIGRSKNKFNWKGLKGVNIFIF